MARGTQLDTLLAMFRAEARISRSADHNVSSRDAHIQLLSRIQRHLWEAHDWPNLRVARYAPLTAGQRYYDLAGVLKLDGAVAGDISIDRLETIDVNYGGQWSRARPGITQDHLNVHDSDAGELGWPVQRWGISEDEMVEVWPIPTDSGSGTSKEGWLRLTGIRNLSPLFDSLDEADLDDDLIVLHAAAEHLASIGAQDAPLKLEAAKARERRLTSNLSKRQQFRLFNAGQRRPEAVLRGPPRVHYRTEG